MHLLSSYPFSPLPFIPFVVVVVVVATAAAAAGPAICQYDPWWLCRQQGQPSPRLHTTGDDLLPIKSDHVLSFQLSTYD